MSQRDRRGRRDQSDLDDLSEELSVTLRDLRDELRTPRGPFGLPRPPTPREVLRFTESYAIPTAVAVLEANIRALELLAAAIRAVEGGASDAERARDRAESVSRATLERLDDALVSLQDALEGRPENDEARRLLDEARELRAEIDDRLRETPRSADRGGTGGADPDKTTRNVHEVPVDVESELDSIKRDLDESDGGDEDDGAEDDDR